MRRTVCLAAALVLTASAAARADEQADMKALVEKAIKATGGEAKLAKYKAQVFKFKGKFYGMGEGIDYTGEWSLQLPHQTRVQIDVEAGGMKFTAVIVVNGKKVWRKMGDQTMEVTDKDEIAESEESGHAGWVTTLLPLKGKGFQLAPLGELKVDGKPAVGVRVSHKGHRDVNLFFDKDKGLLVKSETVIKDVMAGGKEVTQETLYSDHKETEGIKHPMKIVINRDGKKYVDSEVTAYEPKEKIDETTFGKP